ncbi:unnamed protein product [Ilex paraguariensis]|uniref:tRNA-binding domain-containing protein n=1 Tax=Ilex paraguariensis TaxID=185542 RepID=A0ABC8QX23_9AQUA
MADESSILSRKRNITSALCKRLSLDPKFFLDDVDSDIKSLCAKILKSSQNEAVFDINDELMKWIAFAENFPVDSEACFRSVNELNEGLGQNSVLFGGGLKPSEADIVVFSAVHSFVFGLSDSERLKLTHLLRWMDYIQNKEDLGGLFENIKLEKAVFEPPQSKVDSNAKKTVQGAKDVKKVTGDNEVVVEKKKVSGKEADEKDKEISVSSLKLQVGLVRKAWKHPSADSLLVEEIDIGDIKCRQVVSGLAKYLSPEEMMNRRVVLITNVKPGKLRDVMSEGLVLCASNEDHTIVVPLTPPEGATIGEHVSFSGHEGKPEDVLNPKKKQFDKIAPHLFTNDEGVATFKGIPFMTSAGPCTSSIPKASIK